MKSLVSDTFVSCHTHLTQILSVSDKRQRDIWSKITDRVSKGHEESETLDQDNWLCHAQITSSNWICFTPTSVCLGAQMISEANDNGHLKEGPSQKLSNIRALWSQKRKRKNAPAGVWTGCGLWSGLNRQNHGYSGRGTPGLHRPMAAGNPRPQHQCDHHLLVQWVHSHPRNSNRLI